MPIADILSAAMQDHRAGRIADAIGGYRRLLAQEPHHVDALHLLGCALLQTGQPDDGVGMIEQAIARSGAGGPSAGAQHAPLYVNLGGALHACGQVDRAIDSYRRGLTLAPQLPELHVGLGKALLARGEPAAAVECHQAALAIRPAYCDALLNLADALAALERADLAIATYRKALALEPGHARAHNNLGNLLLAAGRSAEGLDALRAAAAADPRSVDIRTNLASALAAAGQFDAALESYRRVIADHPAAAAAHFNLGNLLLARGDASAAAECYRHAIAARPDYAEAHYNLARVRHDQGDPQGAEDSYRAALAFDPQTGPAIFNLANLLIDQERFAEAASLLRRLVELEPANAQAFCLLGMALGGDQQLDTAVASYRRALALKTDFAEAYYNLGHTLADCGQDDAARSAFEAALAVRPQYPEAHRSLGTLLQGLGREDEAAACFGRALRLQPLITRPAAGKPAFGMLLLVAPGRGNTPIDYLTRQAPYDSHTLLFLPGFDYDLAQLRARTDVVFNLISDVDLGGELLPAAADLIARIGRPVINHPERIWPTDRGSIARTLSGLAHAVVPATERYAKAALADARAVAIEPPFLLRPAGTHGGEEMELLTDRDQIAPLVAASAHDAFYVTRFVDYRSSDGYFRKYRLIFIGDEILPYHLAIADSWKVHYYRTEMVRHDWMRREEAAFLEDAAAAFAPHHLAALDAIRAAVALDFSGIDCGLDRDGRLVVFEVNASMLVHANDPEPVFAYKQAPVARIKRAFEAMVATAAGRVPV